MCTMLQPGKTPPVRYKGPLDVLRHVQAEKGIGGLYRGMTPTLTREVAGNATMFAIYELLKRKAAAMQVLAVQFQPCFGVRISLVVPRWSRSDGLRGHSKALTAAK